MLEECFALLRALVESADYPWSGSSDYGYTCIYCGGGVVGHDFFNVSDCDNPECPLVKAKAFLANPLPKCSMGSVSIQQNQ